MLQTLSLAQQEHNFETRQQVVGTAVLPMQNAINHYDPISLAEMAGVALLNRTDTKFVMRASTLYPQLKQDNFKPKHLLVQKLSANGFPIRRPYRGESRFVQNMIQGESHGRYH